MISLNNKVILGDVLESIREMPDESVDLTFTSPPYYNAREYSQFDNYDEYLTLLDTVFSEVHRITKEGRFLIVNTSPVIVPRKSRKHQSYRIPIPFHLNNYLEKMGWMFIDDIIWAKPEPSSKNRISGFSQHRKPLTYKPNSVSEYVMVYRKHTDRLIDWNLKQYDRETTKKSLVGDGFERSNIWNIAPTHDKIHSAVFPIELCNRIIDLYSFKGDLVFDPFAGSGTLGIAAAKKGRNFLLTEIHEEYIDRIIERMNKENIGYICIKEKK